MRSCVHVWCAWPSDTPILVYYQPLVAPPVPGVGNAPEGDGDENVFSTPPWVRRAYFHPDAVQLGFPGLAASHHGWMRRGARISEREKERDCSWRWLLCVIGPRHVKPILGDRSFTRCLYVCLCVMVCPGVQPESVSSVCMGSIVTVCVLGLHSSVYFREVTSQNRSDGDAISGFPFSADAPGNEMSR